MAQYYWVNNWVCMYVCNIWVHNFVSPAYKLWSSNSTLNNRIHPMHTMKREKKMKILKDNDSVYISIHYTTPFSIIRFEGKSEGSMSGLLEKPPSFTRGRSCGVSKVFSFPYVPCGLAAWNSNRNHDESCTYRFNTGPRSPSHFFLFFLRLWVVSVEHGAKRRSPRLASQSARTSIRHISR